MIVIEGPAVLYYGAASCDDPLVDAYTFTNKLGITESGIQISIQNAIMPVNTDDMGGTEGFPAEYINMSTTGSIRGTLIDYNAGVSGDGWKTIADNLEIGCLNFSGGGKTPSIGKSYFGDSYGFSFMIKGNSASYVFPRCSLLDAPREFTLSTGVKKTTFTITAYPVFNFAISGGVNTCTSAFLYRKITGGETFKGCHDAVGGYKTSDTAGQFDA